MKNNNSPIYNRVANILNISKLEQKAEESSNQLSVALQGIGHGRWSWNLNTDEVTLNEDSRGLLGFGKSKIKINQKSFMNQMHPEDIVNFLREIKKIKLGLSEYINADVRMLTGYEQWNWVNLRCNIMKYDNDAAPLILDGLMYDINEQKQYDEEVQQLQVKVLEPKEEPKEEENIDQSINNSNLDWYTRFRMNGLSHVL